MCPGVITRTAELPAIGGMQTVGRIELNPAQAPVCGPDPQAEAVNM